MIQYGTKTNIQLKNYLTFEKQFNYLRYKLDL